MDTIDALKGLLDDFNMLKTLEDDAPEYYLRRTVTLDETIAAFNDAIEKLERQRWRPIEDAPDGWTSRCIIAILGIPMPKYVGLMRELDGVFTKFYELPEPPDATDEC